MDLIGIWKCVEIMTFVPEKGLVWKTVEEINADPELKESIGNTFDFLDINADGTLKFVMAIPEDTPKEEIDAAIAEGGLQMYDDTHVAADVKPWKIENGVFMYDSGEKGEVFGESVSSWKEAPLVGDILELSMFKFKRA